jgi:hypothetical protein
MLHAPAREAQSEDSKKRSDAAAYLQQTAIADFVPRITGNQARSRTPASGAPMQRPSRMPMLQRKCACGGSAGISGDCAGCTEKKGMLQRRVVQSPGAYAPPVVDDALRAPGQPLDTNTRALMERLLPTHLSKVAPRSQSRMVIGPAGDSYEREADAAAEWVSNAPSGDTHRNHDFSRVRIHNGAEADTSARSVGALAYTVGSDIVFAAGQYAPATARGRNLLAHELAHTVQQTRHSPSVVQRETGDAALVDGGTPSVDAGTPSIDTTPTPAPLQDGGVPDAGVEAGLALPTGATEQLLVGMIFAESSTSGGADEKRCIGLCAMNMAYYATLTPPEGKKRCYNDTFGDGTVLGALKKGFPQSYKSARWNVVMDGDKLKTEAKIKAILQAADMAHFKAVLTAAADAAKVTAPAQDPTSKKTPVQFNQARDSPPSKRQEKIATYKPHTFYGFKAGQECE